MRPPSRTWRRWRLQASTLSFSIRSMGTSTAESLVHLVSACDHFGIASIVRIPTLASWLIGPALDCGSSGVQVPFVSSADEAETAVAAARFAPDGARGVHVFLRGGQYGALGAEGFFQVCNENQAVVLQVEGTRGVENLEAIAAVPGYDSIFIGPYDLSQSLGVAAKPVILGWSKSSRGRWRSAGSMTRWLAPL